MTTIREERINGIDAIRVLACFLVIMLHIAAQGFYQFSEIWTISVVYDSFCRMAVPLFFMISGYLLLYKSEDISQFYKKRFLRILVPFLLTLGIYYFVRDWNAKDFLIVALTTRDKIEPHLWFVYVLIGIYLVVPLFQNLFREKNNRKSVWIYVLIWFFVAVCYPLFCTLAGFNFNVFYNFNFNYFFGFLGFLFIGGGVREIYPTKSTRIILLFITLLMGILIAISTIIWSYHLNQPNELFFDNLTPFVVIQATALFLIVKDLSFHIPYLEFVAKHTYWMYLIHILVLRTIQDIFNLYIWQDALWMIPLLSVIVFFASLIISIPLMFLENIILKCINCIVGFLSITVASKTNLLTANKK